MLEIILIIPNPSLWTVRRNG